MLRMSQRASGSQAADHSHQEGGKQTDTSVKTRSILSLLVTVWAVLCIPATSRGDDVFLRALWAGAFQQEYVSGRSGLMFGSQLQPGVFELLVVDADPTGLTAISAGTVEVYGNWSVTWYPDQTGVIDAVVDGMPVTGFHSATFGIMSFKMTTFTGFESMMTGMGAFFSMHLDSSSGSGDWTWSNLTPIAAYSSAEKANAAASSFAQDLGDLPYIPVHPNDDSQAACAARCINEYTEALQTAQNELDGKLSQCGWLGGAGAGCVGGCTVCGFIGTGLGGPKTGAIGCAACCIGGAIARGVTQYTNCTIQARAEFVTALQNARARLNRCMADCGIVIAEE